mmetsp:Transcript_80552/g.223839  ORF Transcript_80552/g.223839 Transcript_80552/m.223839 type:complete len:82 (-) Transcript_80552:581-826(-)
MRSTVPPKHDTIAPKKTLPFYHVATSKSLLSCGPRIPLIVEDGMSQLAQITTVNLRKSAKLNCSIRMKWVPFIPRPVSETI